MTDLVIYETGGDRDFITPNVRNLTGYSPDQLRKDPQLFWDNIHPDDLPLIRTTTNAWHLAEGPEPLTLQFRLRCADGKYKWIEDREVMIHPASGPRYLVGVMVDISEPKRSELRAKRQAELQALSRRAVIAFAEEPDLSAAIDAMLAESGQFLGVSRAWLCRFRGNGRWAYGTHEWCAPGQPTLKDRQQRIPGDEFRDWIDLFAASGQIVWNDLDHDPPPVRQPSYLAPAGVRALLVLPVFINDASEMFVAYEDTAGPREWAATDTPLLQTVVESLGRTIERLIAERERHATAQRLEEALERAESVSSLKSQFLRSISHELRTPVTAILGYADLIGGGRSRSREETAEFAASIRRNGDFLLALVDDLLDLSKIEAGQLRLVQSDCTLFELIDAVAALARTHAEERRLDLRVRYDGQVPVQFRSDPMRVRQILLNLLGNAIKYTEKGRVELVVSLDTVCEPGQAVLVFTVHDTGIGVPADKLEEIFEPFRQLDAGGAATPGGTGLGLDISRRLARLLGGEILVESTIGVGSSFSLSLGIGPLADVELIDPPSAVSDARAAVQDSPALPRLDDVRVLLVEDGLDNQRVLRLILEEEGATVAIAVNGREGVDAAIEAERLYGVVHDGEWFHIGTPDGLAQAEVYMGQRFPGMRHR